MHSKLVWSTAQTDTSFMGRILLFFSFFFFLIKQLLRMNWSKQIIHVAASKKKKKSFPLPHLCHSSVPCQARAAGGLEGQPLSRKPKCMWRPIRRKTPSPRQVPWCLRFTRNELFVSVCVCACTLGNDTPVGCGVHLGCVIVCWPVSGDGMWHPSLLCLRLLFVLCDINTVIGIMCGKMSPES